MKNCQWSPTIDCKTAIGFTGSRISGIFFPLKDEVEGVRLQV